MNAVNAEPCSKLYEESEHLRVGAKNNERSVVGPGLDQNWLVQHLDQIQGVVCNRGSARTS